MTLTLNLKELPVIDVGGTHQELNDMVECDVNSTEVEKGCHALPCLLVLALRVLGVALLFT